MATEQNEQISSSLLQSALTNRKLAMGNELCAASKHAALERKLFELALALATEPSKLLQLRQMLLHLQEQTVLSEDFTTCALERIDERVMSMALEYAHDAESLIQILSFKGGSFASLMQDIENLYQQKKITQRVYAKAKLLMRTADPKYASN